MIHRDYRNPDDPVFFEGWKRSARRATAKAIRYYRTPGLGRKPFDFDSEADVWRSFKPHLLQLFHGKCSYCESDFRSVDKGEVEHYRPKRRVSEDRTHPGYYWLAFDPSNFLLAC